MVAVNRLQKGFGSLGATTTNKRDFIETGNALSSRFSPMTLDTQMTLALLQELLMALSANDANGRSVGVLIHNEAGKILIPLWFS